MQSIDIKKANTEKPMHDLGAANATLMLQATAMGIHGHPMAGSDKAKAIEMLNLDSEKMEPVAFIALGYLDEA